MSDAIIGSIFGSYKLTSILGRGGMATVYKGYQEAVDRYVAVKVLPAELMHDANFLARFTNEARTLARLTHPAILPLYDFGNANGMPYIVMPLMTGGSLADKVTKGPLPVSEIGRIFTPIAQALDFAHRQGVLHRDVKPNNIMFDQHDNPFLSDFGIAKAMESSSTLTGTGVIGTPDYMSPEQARGEIIDGRSDVYSLGVVAYQALTGQQLFQATTPMGVIFKHATEAPRPLRDYRPEIPLAVEKVILKALAKSPAERYQTATEFAQALVSVTSTVSANVSSSATMVGQGSLTPPVALPPVGQPLTSRTGPQSPADPMVTLLPSDQAMQALRNPTPPAPQPPVKPPPERKSNTKVIIGGVVGAVLCLVVVCGAGGYYAATQTNWLAQLTGSTAVARATDISPTDVSPTDIPPTDIVPTDVPPTDIPPTDVPSTPQNGLIAFISKRDGNFEIYSMAPDGTNQVRLTNNSTDDYEPAWSPDGKKLAFQGIINGDWEVYVMNADGTGVTDLTLNSAVDGQPAWSPDGKQIAFASNRDLKNFNIFVMNSDGSGVFQLTADSGENFSPSWSPDGTRLVFTSDRNGKWDIYTLTLDGSKVVQVTNMPAGQKRSERPAWSPDGKQIAFAYLTDQNFEIYLVNPDGTQLTQLTRNTTDDIFVAWAPDGTRLAFTSERDGNREIYTMKTDGTEVQRLTNEPLEDARPTWQPILQ